MVGTNQLCAGQPGGCEAAVHAVRRLYESSDCETILLVNASITFNSLDRHLALHNIYLLCPSVATILINCYRVDVLLFIDGDILFSSEGTTQGDPLAMIMYAVGVIPLIHHLHSASVSQVWYADDAAALGSLHYLRCWWEELLSSGTTYGYFANPTKSC